MYKTKLPTGVRVLLGFLSVILCILLFVSTLVTIIVADVRLVTSKDGLQTIITQALFPTPAPVSPIGALAAGVPVLSPVSGTGNEAQGAIVDAIYGMLSEQFGEELPISQEQVEQFLSDSTLPEFVSEKVAGIVNDIYTGESTTTITKEEVMDLLTENADLIKENLGVELNTEAIEAVGKWVEENDVMSTVQEEVSKLTGLKPPASVKPDGTGKPITGTTTDEEVVLLGTTEMLQALLSGDFSVATIPNILNLVRTLTSVTALLICLGVCLLIIGLLMLTHWGRPFAAIRSVGIPVMIAGIVMSVPAILAVVMPSLFTGTVMVIAKQILAMTGYVGYGVAALGLAMIVVGAVLNSKMKKKVAAAAVETVPVSVGAGTVEDTFTEELTETPAETEEQSE